MNEPIVEIKLYVDHPSPAGRCRSRRGIPDRPSACWTKKVMLKPMNMTQNDALPSRSFSSRPVIFGNQ